MRCAYRSSRMRRVGQILLGMSLLVAAVAWTQPSVVVVEDWSKHAAGVKGIPEGWKGQRWGNATYDLIVVEEDSTKALHLKSRDEGSTISKEVHVNVKDTPILEWQWKAAVLPAGGDCRKAETDDEAAQLYVTFPRFPATLRSRVIGYVWDTTAPEGTIAPSEKSFQVTYVVVRSGTRDVNRWITESRNVYEDYMRIYHEEPGELGVVSIGIDSNDTHSSAESYFGTILFRKP